MFHQLFGSAIRCLFLRGIANVTTVTFCLAARAMAEFMVRAESVEPSAHRVVYVEQKKNALVLTLEFEQCVIEYCAASPSAFFARAGSSGFRAWNTVTEDAATLKYERKLLEAELLEAIRWDGRVDEVRCIDHWMQMASDYDDSDDDLVELP